MKIKLLVGTLFLSAGALCAADFSSQSGSNSMGSVNVTVSSDLKDLAQGYAAAFSQVTHVPVTMVLARAGERYSLEDVRSVKASGGVLIVEIGRGTVYLVNPQDVLTITEGAALKPLPALVK